MGSSNAYPMDVVSDRWHVKRTEEVTHSSQHQFDSSAGHDQPSLPVVVICMSQPLYCLSVEWLSGYKIWMVQLRMCPDDGCVCVWFMSK